MSQSERRIADTPGRFIQFVKAGERVEGARWANGRVLLSNRRLVLAGKGGKRTLSLSAIDAIKGRAEVDRAVAGVSNYTSLRVGEDVVLLSTREHRSFELDLCTALLAGERVRIRHPAVEGGVVRDTEWESATVDLGSDETVNVATSQGSFVQIELDDVGNVAIEERTVSERTRRVIVVEHTEDGTSVETHLAGTPRSCSSLRMIFARALSGNGGEVELTREQKQVLVALYAGVSPFEIPAFTGVGVEAVEETYERLIESDVLSLVRKRREVELTPRGRNLASEAISDE